MRRSLFIGIRLGGIILALTLMLQFLQPQKAFAADTITIQKTVLAAASCAGAAPYPAVGFGASTTVNSGQCVSINIAITNNSTSNAITALTLSDPFPPGGELSGVPGSCGAPSTSTYTCTVTASGFSFTTGAGYPPLPAGATRSESFKASVTGDCGTATTNVGNGSATFVGGATATGSGSAVINVTGCPAPTTTPLNLNKTIDGFSCAPGQCAANVGDLLNYRLSYSNTGTTTTANNVTITDALAPGQTYVDSSGNCTPSNNAVGGTTLTCVVGPVPASPSAGSSGLVRITTRVNGATNQIQNTGYITASNISGGASTASNTTYVAVFAGQCTGLGCNNCDNFASCDPCTIHPNTCGNRCGSCSACGTCYPPFTCGVCGPSNPCNTGCGYPCNTGCGNPCTTGCGYPCNTGCGNPCTTGCGYPCNTGCGNPCTTGCGTPYNPCFSTSICNQFGSVPVMCGVVTTYTAAGAAYAGNLGMSGLTYSVAPNTQFGGTVIAPGRFYCFLFNANTFITGCLTSVVTGLDDASGAIRQGKGLVD